MTSLSVREFLTESEEFTEGIAASKQMLFDVQLFLKKRLLWWLAVGLYAVWCKNE